MDSFSLFLFPLLIAVVLDLLIGDPHRMPHPIRLFGRCIAMCEQQFNKGSHRKAKGIAVALSLSVGSFLFFYLAEHLLLAWDRRIGFVFISIFVFYGICIRSLIQEVYWVEKAIRSGDLTESRRRLSYIVGRDTSQLSYQQIRTAMIETLAENLSDGVIAPLFFYTIGGMPAMMMYKMINTMDSMIGYKNERYADFGYFAARILDDGANYIPSRFTALVMFLSRPSLRTWQFIRRYARAHTSPNSGFPESAMAGILNIRMGGPNVYHGKQVMKPYIGEQERELTHNDIIRAFSILLFTALLSIFLFSIVRYFLYLW